MESLPISYDLVRFAICKYEIIITHRFHDIVDDFTCNSIQKQLISNLCIFVIPYEYNITVIS